MKKICLFLAFGLVIQPAFSADYYSKIANNSLGVNTKSNYMIIPRRYYNSNISRQDMLFLQGMMLGNSLYSGRLNLLANPSLRNSERGMLAYLDPYIIRIDNNDYVLVKDNKDNKWTVENILGYDDSKEDLFASLKKFESDGDLTKLTSEELQKAGIRFVLLNNDGSLALNDRKYDYDINNVLYIDMKNLRTALGNKNQDGTFGYFYVYVKDAKGKKVVPGRVTFEEKADLHKYIK